MLFDGTVVEAIVDGTPVWLAFCFLFISYLGSIYVIGPATVFVYLRGKTPQTASWIGIILATYACFVVAKPILYVERPPVASPLAGASLPILIDQLHELAVGFDTGSFPSGHVIAATVLYGLFVYDIDWRTRRLRLLLSSVVVLLIGISRLVLGIHYLGDVIGGFVIGVVLLSLALGVREISGDPYEATLGFATIFAVGGLFTGRAIDSVVIIIAISIAFLAHRRLNLRDNRFTYCSNKS